MVVDPIGPQARQLMEAARVLGAGGVVAYPTDTLYGLAVDPRSADAVEKLYRIKGRPVDRAVPLIAADGGQLDACGVTLRPLAAALAEAFWPGPLTLVLPAWPGLAVGVHGGLGTVAVRVPAHAIARGLAAALGYPITSTSANPSGAEPPASAEAVVAGLGSAIDLLIDGGATVGGPPSTIVDMTTDRPRLLRAGAIAWDRVLEFLQRAGSHGS